MSKSSVIKKSEAVPATSSQNFFEKYGQAAAGRSWVGDLGRFSKFGNYVLGAENIEIPLGTKAAAYMQTFCVGFVHWENLRRIEQVMGPIAEGYVPPPRSELGLTDQSAWEQYDDGRPKDPWQFTNTIVFKEMEGDRFFTFTTSSKGGLNALGQLSTAYGHHMRAHPDEYPIVALERGSYQHPNRSYGEIRFPIFRIDGYVLIKNLPPLEGFGPTPAIEASGGKF
jgi:hypothetical protein